MDDQNAARPEWLSAARCSAMRGSISPPTNTNSFNAEFIDLITRHAWADIWTRPHFDERTRRVLVIRSLLALGQWG